MKNSWIENPNSENMP
jgi:hypothetical protein